MTQVFEAPVVRVQLAEDRAEVVRSGEAILPGGRHTLTVQAVSPVIVDKTLHCRVVAGAASVVDCRVERWARVMESQKQEAVVRLEREITEKRTRRDHLDADIAVMEQELRDEAEAFSLSLDELAEEVAWGRFDKDAWNQKLDAIESQREPLERIARLERTREELALELRDLETQLMTISSADRHLDAALHIDLEVKRAQMADPIALEVTYIVPGACWRPRHTAELLDGTARVRFRCDGVVWQNTGEDWEGVKVVFSTERISLGTAPPLLESDVLRSERAGELVEVAAREETILKSGLGRAERLRELPGIDDGGTSLTLEGRTRTTIPSSGRPKRVELFEFETEANCELRLFGELEKSVILVSEQANRAIHPLLPGPVDLIRERGIVGRGEVKFVAPGERFELGFGPDDALRVHREKEILKHKERILSAWTETPYRVTLYLTNLGPEPRRVMVRERILVSDIDKIKVIPDPDRTTDRAAPDENGFVDWRVTVPGRDLLKIRLYYTIEKHSNVVGLEI